jgi:hypothetical protein
MVKLYYHMFWWWPTPSSGMTKKNTPEDIYLVMHTQLCAASSFNTQLVYVTLPSMCEINKLGVVKGDSQHMGVCMRI